MCWNNLRKIHQHFDLVSGISEATSEHSQGEMVACSRVLNEALYIGPVHSPISLARYPFCSDDPYMNQGLLRVNKNLKRLTSICGYQSIKTWYMHTFHSDVLTRLLRSYNKNMQKPGHSLGGSWNCRAISKKHLHTSSRPFKASADVTRVTMSWRENDIFQLEDIRQIWDQVPGV